jgi:hypothetical protein
MWYVGICRTAFLMDILSIAQGVITHKIQREPPQDAGFKAIPLRLPPFSSRVTGSVSASQRLSGIMFLPAYPSIHFTAPPPVLA